MGAGENAEDSPSHPPLQLEVALKASSAHQERRTILLSDFEEMLSFLDGGWEDHMPGTKAVAPPPPTAVRWQAQGQEARCRGNERGNLGP